MHPVLIVAVTVGLQILSTVVEPLMVENEKFRVTAAFIATGLITEEEETEGGVGYPTRGGEGSLFEEEEEETEGGVGYPIRSSRRNTI